MIFSVFSLKLFSFQFETFQCLKPFFPSSCPDPLPPYCFLAPECATDAATEAAKSATEGKSPGRGDQNYVRTVEVVQGVPTVPDPSADVGAAEEAKGSEPVVPTNVSGISNGSAATHRPSPVACNVSVAA